MKRREVTPDMIARAKACDAWQWPDRQADDALKVIIDAAINPPPEPGIEVTRDMLDAAGVAWDKSFSAKPHGGFGRSPLTDKAFAAAYRAMHAARPLEYRAIMRFDEGFQHRRSTDYRGNAARYHRRAGDKCDHHFTIGGGGGGSSGGSKAYRQCSKCGHVESL